ncbi:5505_t:CDS:1, partial [Cetraspora pellucida]
TEQHQQVFDTLRSHLISDLILQHTNFNQPFYLYTNASISELRA